MPAGPWQPRRPSIGDLWKAAGHRAAADGVDASTPAGAEAVRQTYRRLLAEHGRLLRTAPIPPAPERTL